MKAPSKPLLLIIAFSALLSACGGELPPSAVNGYRAPEAGSQAQNALQGAWTSVPDSQPCTPSGSGYTKQGVFFYGSQFSLVAGQFSDSDCSQLQYQVTVGKDYSLTGDPAASTQPMTTVSKQNTGLVTAGNAAAANAASFCGLANWQDGVSQDVSGRTCLGIAVPALGASASESVTISSATTLSYDSLSYTKSP